MSSGGPNPGQFIPTNSPTPYDSSQYDNPVAQYSDAQRAGPPQVNIPYTPESQFNPQQNGTLGVDENGLPVRILQGGGSAPQSTLTQPVGPSANTLPPAVPPSGVTPPNGLFDNLGGYGGGYGGPPRRLF